MEGRAAAKDVPEAGRTVGVLARGPAATAMTLDSDYRRKRALSDLDFGKSTRRLPPSRAHAWRPLPMRVAAMAMAAAQPPPLYYCARNDPSAPRRRTSIDSGHAAKNAAVAAKREVLRRRLAAISANDSNSPAAPATSKTDTVNAQPREAGTSSGSTDQPRRPAAVTNPALRSQVQRVFQQLDRRGNGFVQTAELALALGALLASQQQRLPVPAWVSGMAQVCATLDAREETRRSEETTASGDDAPPSARIGWVALLAEVAKAQRL